MLPPDWVRTTKASTGSVSWLTAGRHDETAHQAAPLGELVRGLRLHQPDEPSLSDNGSIGPRLARGRARPTQKMACSLATCMTHPRTEETDEQIRSRWARQHILAERAKGSDFVPNEAYLQLAGLSPVTDNSDLLGGFKL